MTRITGPELTAIARDAAPTPFHTTDVLLLDGPLGRAELLARVADRLDYVPRFRQAPRGAVGAESWADDQAFDAEAHVRDLPVRPGANLADLERQVTELQHEPLGRAGARWEVGLAGLRAGRAAVVARVNPAWVDGVANAHLVAELVDDVPTPEVPQPAAWEPEAAPEVTDDVRAGVMGALRSPATLLGATVGLLGRVGSAGAARVRTPAPTTRHATGVALPLPAVDAVATGAGTTRRDVVLALLAGALARAGWDGEAAVFAPVPVADADAAAAGCRLEPSTLALPLSGSPAARLAHVASLTEIAPAMPDATLERLPGFAPATIHAMAAGLPGAAAAPVALSWAAGPASARYLGERRITAAYCVPPLAGAQRVAVGATSYGDRLWLGIAGTDPVEALARGFVAELHAMSPDGGESSPC